MQNTGARRSSGNKLPPVWWAVPGALVGAVVIYVAHRGLIDDAYITLSYARNVAAHLHWGLIPTEESNTATSPLNVILLAVATWIAGVTGELRPVLGLGILTVALSAAMAVWAAQIARRIDVSRRLVAGGARPGVREPVRELGARAGGRAHRRISSSG